MQVTCIPFKWDEVEKRKVAQKIVDEMILTDDIDNYSVPLPDGVWTSDSGSQHFEVVEALYELSQTDKAEDHDGLDEVRRLLSNEGPSIDELGIAALTDHCYYISMSPKTVARMAKVFGALDLGALAEDAAEAGDGSADEIEQWLKQWKDALAFAASKNLGLIGHCG